MTEHNSKWDKFEDILGVKHPSDHAVYRFANAVINSVKGGLPLIEAYNNAVEDFLNTRLTHSNYVPKIETAINWSRLGTNGLEEWGAERLLHEGIGVVEEFQKRNFDPDIEKCLIYWKDNEVTKRSDEAKNPDDFMEIFNCGPSEFLSFFVQVLVAGKIMGLNTKNSIESVAGNESMTNPLWHACQIHMLEKAIRHGKMNLTYNSPGAQAEVASSFDDRTLDRVISSSFSIGFLYRDAWWLIEHGEAAAEYYKRVDGWNAQQAGRKVGSDTTRNKSEIQKEKSRELVAQAFEERGFKFACATDEVQAETIRDIALKTRPVEFEFQSGKLLSPQWFKERIEGMKSTGEFSALANRVLGKA